MHELMSHVAFPTVPDGELDTLPPSYTLAMLYGKYCLSPRAKAYSPRKHASTYTCMKPIAGYKFKGHKENLIL